MSRALQTGKTLAACDELKMVPNYHSQKDTSDRLDYGTVAAEAIRSLVADAGVPVTASNAWITPEGASSLAGWCSSTISTDGKNRAASWANFMSSTAPMPKFGAMTTPSSGLGSSHSAIVASLASSAPRVHPAVTSSSAQNAHRHTAASLTRLAPRAA